MKITIVCFIGDYAICKNEETGEVFNINSKELKDIKEGDKVSFVNGSYIKEEKEKQIDWNKCYIYDDVIIEMDDLTK
ncbi:hypothetical protein KQI86_00175 [Clostridium sp. MSJ-11]|uniref:Uncharacterized protein n=1 Tax=Clostridium mobile TaxID=2841512 RepID=A0ABS6EBZ3_9CLOT|nr:hypothetical protein [Clostridium mobile]MBU5482716.1 hypothetical protein [Clostridium mobile]